MVFSANILTIFPEMFPGPLACSLPGKALEQGLWELGTINLREFAEDKHQSVDDTPYGGGAGMLMKPDVVGRAIDQALTQQPDTHLIHLSPRGAPLTQAIVDNLAEKQSLTMLCGRFEGVDERINQHYQPQEISIGDFVLFGGELAAMVLLEAVLRQIPGVLGNPDTKSEESFSLGKERALLLEYPHYTKPPFWQGLDVPEVLVSGHHERIDQWRREEAERITKERRPDLWERYIAQKEQKE